MLFQRHSWIADGSARRGGEAARRALTLGLAVFAVGSVLRAVRAGEADSTPFDLLPDLIVVEDYLRDNEVIPASGERRLLRLSTATANLGGGEFRIEGRDSAPDAERRVVEQVIQQSDGTSRRRVAGEFEFHAAHGHVHTEAWALYRLRERTAGDGVGAILGEGRKTSFCVVDLIVHDPTLPGYRETGTFRTCETAVQGLSVGWADFYHKFLPDQHVDVTGVADGVYWLEVVVDPDDHFLESDEENNTARVLVTLGDAVSIERDAYEPNDTVTGVDARTQGAIHSPNLGPANPRLHIKDLTIHESGDRDVFKFYVNDTGTTGTGVWISYVPGETLLDLELLDAGSVVLERAVEFQGSQHISLAGRPRGWYYARVSGTEGVVSGMYSMSIVPPSNEPPGITVLRPAAGEISLRHAIDNFRVEWTATDPEADAMWVDVYVNTVAKLDGREILLPGSVRTAAELGFHVLHSPSIPPGKYRVYCEVTDGGSTAGAWSDGWIEFEEQPIFIRGDCDGDGRVTGRLSDAIFMLRYNFTGDVSPPCLAACDANGDGKVNGQTSDAIHLLRHNFLGGPPPPQPFFECGHGLLPGDAELGCAVPTESCP